MDPATGVYPGRCLFLLVTLLLLLAVLTSCGGTSNTAAPTTNKPSPGNTTSTSTSAEFAFVSLSTGSGIAGVKVDSSGTASAIAGSPFAAPGATFFATRHGQLVFAVTGDPVSVTSKIHTFTEDASSGQLKLTSSFSYAQPIGGLALDPSGTHLYAALNNGIAEFAINSSGQLTELAGSPFQTLSFGGPIIVTPNDRFVHGIGDIGQKITLMVIHYAAINGATGQLVPGSYNFVRANVSLGLAVTPDSRFLVVTSPGVPGSGNQVCAYAIDQTTGAPGGAAPNTDAQPAACIAAGGGPSSVAIHPGGKWVAVTNSISNDLSMYSFANGAFTLVLGSPFAAGSKPQGAGFSSDGKYLFVSNTNSGDVSVFAVDSSTGALTPVPGSPVQVGGGPWTVAAP